MEEAFWKEVMASVPDSLFGIPIHNCLLEDAGARVVWWVLAVNREEAPGHSSVDHLKQAASATLG
jgi:hypothetical protein